MNKRKIVLVTSISGLSEPLGVLLGVSLLSNASNEVIEMVLAFTAGVMTCITADELRLIAHEHGYKHAVSTDILLEIIFMMILNGFMGL